MGAQRHQDVDHQRRHRQGADVHVVVASVEPELKGRGHASFVVPPGTPGPDAWARSSRRWASAPATPPRSSSTTCASPARCLLGGKEKLDARLARAREGKSSRGAGGDEHVRGEPPARRRAGARHRARRVRVLARLRQGAQGVRPADHREPGDRVQARRHEDGDRRGPPARVAGVLDGRATASSSTPAKAR